MEDFGKLFDGITPENYQDKILKIQESFSEVRTHTEELEKIIGTQNEQIANLRDTNQRLFLRVSAGTTEEKHEEPTEITLDDIIANI